MYTVTYIHHGLHAITTPNIDAARDIQIALKAMYGNARLWFRGKLFEA